MSQNLFDPDTVSGNESFPPPLELGKHRYTIASARQTAKDGTPTGVAFNFKNLDTGRVHSHMYAIFAAGDRGRIAKGDLKALWDACKLEGQPGLDRLPNFIGKNVEINAIHTVPNDEGVFFANIRGTWPADGSTASTTPATSPQTAPAQQYHQPEDKDDAIPMQHATDAPAATDVPAGPKPGSFAERRRARLAGAAS